MTAGPGLLPQTTWELRFLGADAGCQLRLQCKPEGVCLVLLSASWDFVELVSLAGSEVGHTLSLPR